MNAQKETTAKYRARAILCGFVVTAILTMSQAAQACQELMFDARMEYSLAVIHARVLDARLVRLDAQGTLCDVSIDLDRCRRIEVHFNVMETFKAAAEGFEIFHAPLPSTCFRAITVGEEYVFFLHDRDGLIEPLQGSFAASDDVYLRILGRSWQKSLDQLRAWKAQQQEK